MHISEVKMLACNGIITRLTTRYSIGIPVILYGKQVDEAKYNYSGRQKPRSGSPHRAFACILVCKSVKLRRMQFAVRPAAPLE